MKRKRTKAEFDMVHCTLDQIREIEQDIAYLEKMLESDQAQRTPKITDVAEFKSEIEKKRKILLNHKPRKLTGQKANKAYAKAKELRKIIQDAMPSRKEYYRQYPKGSEGTDFDFERAVRQQIAFQTDKGMQENVRQYKAILRRLDPDDPVISNIELLRK